MQGAEVRLGLKGGGRGAHVHRDGRACGEVLRVDVEELVHVGGVRDEPLKLEVLVGHRGAPDAHTREDGEEEEGHPLSHGGGHVGHEALQAPGELAALEDGFGKAAATAASLRVLDGAFWRAAAAAAVDAVGFDTACVQGQAWQEDGELEGVAQDD